MLNRRFNIGDREICWNINLLGQESIIYEGRVVSEKSSYGLSSTHQFEVNEGGEAVKYDVTFKISLSGIIHSSIKRNNLPIKEVRFSVITGFIIRLLLFGIGFSLVSQALLIAFPYRQTIVERYAPESLVWLFVGIGINCILGFCFLLFAVFFRRLLTKALIVITTALWIYIGLLIVSLVPVISNSIARGSILNYGSAIALKIFIIWGSWALLENCKALAQEIKYQ